MSAFLLWVSGVKGMSLGKVNSSNFQFLEEHDAVFLQLATTAELVFSSDPNTTLIKLLQLGEALAQNIADTIDLRQSLPGRTHRRITKANQNKTRIFHSS